MIDINGATKKRFDDICTDPLTRRNTSLDLVIRGDQVTIHAYEARPRSFARQNGEVGFNTVCTLKPGKAPSFKRQRVVSSWDRHGGTFKKGPEGLQPAGTVLQKDLKNSLKDLFQRDDFRSFFDELTPRAQETLQTQLSRIGLKLQVGDLSAVR